MGVRSFGTTPVMLASEEPSISQRAIESHSATECESSMARFSGMLCGVSQPSTAASTRQKRFCGWP